MLKKILSMQFVTLAITIIAVMGVLTYLQREETIRSFSEQQSTLLQFGIDNIQLGLSYGQLDNVKKTFQHLQTYSIFEGAILYDTEMNPLLVIPEVFKARHLSRNETALKDQNILYKKDVLIDENGEKIGYLMIAFTLAPVETATRKALSYALMTGGGIFSLSILTSGLQIRKMIRPLGKAVLVLEALANGDLTQKLLTKKERNDEIS
ncbi:MAG: hypothetical protein ACE5FY_06215 [Nitrospiria bacterium]